MKELSIEEKAKAYDEAIKRAQAKMEVAKVFDYDDEQTAHTIRLTTTDIFPELKESEDEKIRKEIISAIKEDWPGHTDWIAWLEKQGKNNMGISEATKQELEDSLHKALEKETPESCNEFLEKQGEQKPAWSEEEEKKQNYLIALLQNSTMNNPALRSVNEGLEEWLKSLKDRVQPQPKQEWSEEDKNRINRLIAYFEDKESFTAEDDIEETKGGISYG